MAGITATAKVVNGVDVTAFVTNEIVDLVKGSLAPKRTEALASIAFYETALSRAGVDASTLSFSEIVEVTRRLYAESADYRRAVRKAGEKVREDAANAAKLARALETADKDEARELAGVAALAKSGALDEAGAKAARERVAARFAKLRATAKGTAPKPGPSA